MPIAVAFMVVALDEMNAIVRALRTTVTVELADISEILAVDKSGDGEVDFAEFQKWWGGNKTRAQVMSRVAMQMDRDAANKEEAQPGLPAMVFVAMAAGLTALFVLPVFATILTSHNLNNWELVEEEVQ